MIYDVRELSFTYPGSQRRVLDRVSLTLERGQTVSILGPNGAGKSTLLNCMMGLLHPPTGSVLLEGRDLGELGERAVARLVSYVPQNQAPVFGYTVFEYVMMGRAPLIPTLGRPGPGDREAVEQALERMGLADLARRPCTELSGGERQKAAVARAIVRSPLAVLFDEPTAHLDFGNQLRTLRLIKGLTEQGYATVVTTHNPDHAILLGGSAALLSREGQLTVGPTEEIIREDTLCRVYETDLKLRYLEELGRQVCLYPNL